MIYIPYIRLKIHKFVFIYLKNICRKEVYQKKRQICNKTEILNSKKDIM